MQDNLEMRDSAGVVHISPEDQTMTDHTENYGGNAGESSKSFAIPSERLNSPTPSRVKRGKQTKEATIPRYSSSASTPIPISRKGGEKSTFAPRTESATTSPTSSPKGDADGQQNHATQFGDAIRKSSRKGLPGHTHSDNHSLAAGQENSGDIHVTDGDQSQIDITTPEASVSGTRSRKKAGKVDGVQQDSDTQARHGSIDRTNSRKGKIGEGHCGIDTHCANALPDLRFSDPLVMEIVQLHRMRRRWMKARNSLILQGKAFTRALSGGDKDVANVAFTRVAANKADDSDEVLLIALSPFLPAIERFDTEMSAVEKRLEKLAKRLDVAPWVAEVKGFGFAGLAAIVGEAGDLSQYRSISAVWKRLGLAVIDGDGRQRKCANADQALAHGYSPERRSIIWVIADSMAKHQRTWLDKETGGVKKAAGPYGEVLEREKDKALAKGWAPIHAERHAKRVMSKELLKDLTLEWRRTATI